MYGCTIPEKDMMPFGICTRTTFLAVAIGRRYVTFAAFAGANRELLRKKLSDEREPNRLGKSPLAQTWDTYDIGR